jgi:hypothetical protein
MAGGPYRIVQFDRPLGTGVSDSWRLSVSAVAKYNEPAAAPYCLPNELICGEIGRFLGLHVPPGAIVYAQGHSPAEHWFASLDFNLTGNSLPPVDVDDCVAQLPDLSTGLLLFDILVANCDRHAGNFAVDFLASGGPQMSVFDHGHALFGFVPGQGLQRLTDLRDRLGASGGTVTTGNRHCLMDVLNTSAYFQKWLDRIRAAPNFFLEERCQAAVGLGVGDPEGFAAVDFLKYRRDNLVTILNNHRPEFRGIAQWSLLS